MTEEKKYSGKVKKYENPDNSLGILAVMSQNGDDEAGQKLLTPQTPLFF